MKVGCEDIQSSFDKAMQVFRAVDYPAPRQDLINLAEAFDICNEVMQAILNLPDREYNSSADAINALENTYRMLCNSFKI